MPKSDIARIVEQTAPPTTYSPHASLEVVEADMKVFQTTLEAQELEGTGVQWHRVEATEAGHGDAREEKVPKG